MGGGGVGYCDIKANSVQLQLPTGTELGNKKICALMCHTTAKSWLICREMDGSGFQVSG